MNILNTISRRSGVTLIEMLVVVAIMMFMLTIAAPMFRPEQENAVARDTARALNAYIQEARSKAMALGRPCGVAFIPFEQYPSASVVAQQVETPPLYTGDAYNSTVTVSGNGSNPTLNFSNTSSDWLVAGNLIRLGGRGVWYEMTSASACTLQPGESTDSSFRPWSNGNWKTTFEIQAAPICKANNKNYLQSIGMAEPLKVVRGSAIDLGYSKVGATQVNNLSQNPVIVMFTPTGGVGVCYNLGASSSSGSGRGRTGSGAMTSTPSDKIYILCGQWDRALSAFNPEDGKRNHQIYDSYWVVIDPSTGNSSIEQNIP